MKYRVHYFKSTCFEVEAENEDEAIDLADIELDRYERCNDDFYYEFDEVEEVKE